jgi:hypothetical protein
MARKATAVAEAEEVYEYEEGEKAGRRVLGPRGHLQTDVKKVIDMVLEGTMQIEDGAKLTPHRVAALVADYRTHETGVEAEIPSTGAVSAVFQRWADNGIARFHESPKAFKEYTAAAKKHGVQGMLDKKREERRAERARLKAEANGLVEEETPKPVKKAAPRKRAAKKAAAAPA